MTVERFEMVRRRLFAMSLVSVFDALGVIACGVLTMAFILRALAGLACFVLLGADCGPESADPDVGACCLCLSEAFPAPGEPCLYESAEKCKEHLTEGGHPDTWGVCLADFCADVCGGLPLSEIGWSP